MWENGILGHSWWACKMVWTLQKNSMEGPQKVKELPHDPIISLLIPERIGSTILRYLYTLVWSSRIHNSQEEEAAKCLLTCNQLHKCNRYMPWILCNLYIHSMDESWVSYTNAIGTSHGILCSLYIHGMDESWVSYTNAVGTCHEYYAAST